MGRTPLEAWDDARGLEGSFLRLGAVPGIRVRATRFPGKKYFVASPPRAGRWRSRRARAARRRGHDGVSRAEARVPGDRSRGKVARSVTAPVRAVRMPRSLRGDVGNSGFRVFEATCDWPAHVSKSRQAAEQKNVGTDR